MTTDQAARRLLEGAEGVRYWNRRVENGKQLPSLAGVDLSKADLRGVDFSGVDLSNAVLDYARLGSAKLVDAKFQGARLRDADLRDVLATQADFSDVDLTNAHCSGGNFSRSKFVGSNLCKARFDSTKFLDADLTRANVSGANFANSELRGATLLNAFGESCSMARADVCEADFVDTRLENSNLERIIADEKTTFSGASFAMSQLTRGALRRCDLSGVNFYRANLLGADLSGADVQGATFTEATIGEADFTKAVGAQSAIGLETTKGSRNAVYFDKCVRDWFDRLADWERIRVVGNLKLFGVSYTLVLFLLSFFFVVGRYNEKVELMQGWADEVQAADSSVSERILAIQVHEKLSIFHVSKSSIVLLAATLILVVGSIVYTLGCPDEIKDFTRAQWCYQLDQSLVHYWAYAWKRRNARIACAILYVIGGLSFLVLVGIKFFHALSYIWQYIDA